MTNPLRIFAELDSRHRERHIEQFRHCRSIKAMPTWWFDAETNDPRNRDAIDELEETPAEDRALHLYSVAHEELALAKYAGRTLKHAEAIRQSLAVHSLRLAVATHESSLPGEERPHPQRARILTGLLAPVLEVADHLTNYNMATGDPSIACKAWWGEYGQKGVERVGTMSDIEAYDIDRPGRGNGGDADPWRGFIRMVNAIRSCCKVGPTTVHLPIRLPDLEASRRATRALVIHAAIAGVREFVWFVNGSIHHSRINPVGRETEQEALARAFRELEAEIAPMADWLQDGITSAEKWLARPIRSVFALDPKVRTSPRTQYKPTEIPSTAAIIDSGGFKTSRTQIGI